MIKVRTGMLSRPLLMIACFLFGADIHWATGRGAGAIGSYANAQEIPTDATDQWIKSKIQTLRSAGTPADKQKVVQEFMLKLGPQKAQDELLHSGLPFTGDSHLVIHTVGTMIYERYGLEGIAHCRPYFLGACYHGFLIEVIGKRGPQAIADVWAQCKSAGPAITPQCAHGVGHGLLVWKNNSLQDALAICDSLAAEVDHFVPLNCFDGVFMENVWGLHDHMSMARSISMVRNQASSTTSSIRVMTQSFRRDICQRAGEIRFLFCIKPSKAIWLRSVRNARA